MLFKWLVFYLVIVLSMASCTQKETVDEKPKLENVNLPTALVESTYIPNYSTSTGLVEASQTVYIQPQISEIVAKVTVEEGSVVKSGQLLVELNSENIKHEIKAIESNISGQIDMRNQAVNAISLAKYSIEAKEADCELKEKRFKRIDQLHNLNSATDDEYDNALAQLKLAKAVLAQSKTDLEMAQDKLLQSDSAINSLKENLAQAKIKLSYTRILSPLNGVVSHKMVNCGDLVSIGKTILVLENDSYKFVASIPAQNINLIKLKTPVKVALENGDKKFDNLTVDEILPNVDPNSRTFKIKIKLPRINTGIKSGVYGTVSFLTESNSKKIMLPIASVINRGQLSYVYVTHNDGSIEFRLVSLGEKTNDKVEIISGLSSGERVVIGDFDLIKNNVRVNN